MILYALGLGAPFATNRMGTMAVVSTCFCPLLPRLDTHRDQDLAIGSVLLITLVAFEELAATT